MEIFDNYESSGTDYEGFLKELTEFTENTETIVLTNYRFKLLSFQGMENNGFVFALIDENAVNQFNNFIAPLPKVVLNPGLDERPYFEEVVRTSGLILLDTTGAEPSMYMVSQDAVSSLADRAGIDGDLLQKYSLIRNLYIAQGLFAPWERSVSDKFESTIVYRKQYLKGEKYKCIKKAFAFMGSHYVHSSLNNLKEIVDAVASSHPFGSVRCYKWKLTHKQGEIFIEFPEEGQRIKDTYGLPECIIPGLGFTDSDTGRQSFTIKHTFRFENSDNIAVFDVKTWKHTSDLKLDEIYDYMYKTYTSMFAEVPAAFSALLKSKINKKKLAALYKEKLKGAQYVGAIGKKRTSFLTEQLLLNADDSIATEYDVAKSIICCNDIIGEMPDYAKNNLAEACGRIPFLITKDATLKWEG